MIEVRSIKKTYDAVPVLEDISFSVPKGSRVALLGPGGSGKTTILKLILGLVQPDQGEVHLMGTDMVNSSEEERLTILKRVGMAFQQGALFDYMTVAENLNFAMKNMRGFAEDEQERRIETLLATVKLPRTSGMFPYELSGGMQRRVGIARALCTDPEVAIFDEPTAGLDPVTSTIILNMIKELGANDADRALIIATSSVEIAIRFAERVILINSGRVVADGSWKDMMVDGDDWSRHFLGVRLIGVDLEYAHELGLPQKFIEQHWRHA